MNFTTDAINLKSYNLNEYDKIVVMYSKDRGIIRGVAKGTKKPNSKLGGHMDTLVANKVMFYKGKKLDTICQAQSIDSFKELRKDITKLTYAMYCTELINIFGMEEDTNSSNIFAFFFEALKNISLAKKRDDIIFSAIRFQLKLMDKLGYAIELNTCVKCNELIESKEFAFSAESGGIVCLNCQDKVFKTNNFNDKVKKILKEAQDFDFYDSTIYGDASNLEYAFNLLREYVSLRSHKKIKTTELLESLC